MGHCYWASGNVEKALDTYREAVRHSGRDERWFRETFLKDEKHLKSKGFSDLDMSLMIDYVLLGS